MSLESYLVGQLGEEMAVQFLQDRGYRIVERNFHVLKTEVDIIADKEGVIIFVEVKTRSREDYGTGSEAVTYRKQKQLIKAAMAYLKDWSPIRFDVISILIDPRTKKALTIRHYPNAFSCD